MVALSNPWEASVSKRQAVYLDFRAELDGSMLPKGLLRNVAEKYSVHPKTVGHYWKLGKGRSDLQNAI